MLRWRQRRRLRLRLLLLHVRRHCIGRRLRANCCSLWIIVLQSTTR
jgi:hypothetical protein